MREADHSPSSGAKFENAWSYTSVLPYVLWHVSSNTEASLPLPFVIWFVAYSVIFNMKYAKVAGCNCNWCLGCAWIKYQTSSLANLMKFFLVFSRPSKC
jgi:hypothetical protein